MPEPPELSEEELPEDEGQLKDEELDAVNGGLGRTASAPLDQSRGLRRTGNPCDGGE